MGNRFSAYLTLYEDWELLQPSLASIVPFIDELVVVDGAYAWMAGFLQAVGKDPACSSPRVYDQLANLSIPLRIITGIWNSEEEKRVAGYNACTHRFVYRVDADEIVFLDSEAVDRFVASEHSAAQMEIPPVFHTPEWVEAATLSEPIPRVGFLFDRKMISGQQHLAYLWIVHRIANPSESVAPSPEPVAVTAHMTLWRSADGARNRSAFYHLNYFRKYGCHWLPEFKDRPIPDLNEFFSAVIPQAFNNMLLTSAQCVSDFTIGTKVLRPSPLNESQRSILAPLYHRFLVSHEANNLRICSAFQYMLQGAFTGIDVSTDKSLATIERDGTVAIEFRLQPSAVVAELHCLSADAPFEHSIKLKCDILPYRLIITIPNEIRQQHYLRRILRFQVWTNEFQRLQEFRCLAM